MRRSRKARWVTHWGRWRRCLCSAALGLTAGHYWIWPAHADLGTPFPIFKAYEKLRDFMAIASSTSTRLDNRVRMYTTARFTDGSDRCVGVKFPERAKRDGNAFADGSFRGSDGAAPHVEEPERHDFADLGHNPCRNSRGPRNEVDWVESNLPGADLGNLELTLEAATITVLLVQPENRRAREPTTGRTTADSDIPRNPVQLRDKEKPVVLGVPVRMKPRFWLLCCSAAHVSLRRVRLRRSPTVQFGVLSLLLPFVVGCALLTPGARTERTAHVSGSCASDDRSRATGHVAGAGRHGRAGLELMIARASTPTANTSSGTRTTTALDSSARKRRAGFSRRSRTWLHLANLDGGTRRGEHQDLPRRQNQPHGRSPGLWDTSTARTNPSRIRRWCIGLRAANTRAVRTAMCPFRSRSRARSRA